MIQQAINQALGATAAAAIGISKFGDAAAIKKEKSLVAEEEFHNANAELVSLKGQASDLTKTIEKSEETLKALEGKRPGGKGNTKASIEEKRNKALTDREAAQRAFSELTEKIAAKTSVKERAALIMQRLGGKK